MRLGFIPNGLVMGWYTAASGILGALAGELWKLRQDPECVAVTIPEISHDADVALNTSDVDLGRALKYNECVSTVFGSIRCYFIDEDEARKQIENLKILLNVTTPETDVDISIDACNEYMMTGLVVGLAVGCVGTGLFFLLKNKLANKKQSDGNPDPEAGVAMDESGDSLEPPSSTYSSRPASPVEFGSTTSSAASLGHRRTHSG